MRAPRNPHHMVPQLIAKLANHRTALIAAAAIAKGSSDPAFAAAALLSRGHTRLATGAAAAWPCWCKGAGHSRAERHSRRGWERCKRRAVLNSAWRAGPGAAVGGQSGAGALPRSGPWLCGCSTALQRQRLGGHQLF